jgi:hypothetical protein
MLGPWIEAAVAPNYGAHHGEWRHMKVTRALQREGRQ